MKHSFEILVPSSLQKNIKLVDHVVGLFILPPEQHSPGLV